MKTSHFNPRQISQNPQTKEKLRESSPAQTNAPQVSVIVPVYKVEKYLAECIESILAQTFTNFELILVDDGSPDNSGKICDEYTKKDPRIRVFHKENGGVSSARRRGVEESRSEWIMFVDADDKLFSNALNDLVKISKENPEADLIEGITTRDEKKSSPGKRVQSILCASGLEYGVGVASHKTLWLPGPVAKNIRKSVLISSNALDVPSWINYGEDLMMNLKLSLKYSLAIKIDKKIYFQRDNPTSASHTITRTAKYYLKWLEYLEAELNKNNLEIWISVARAFFLVIFLKCNDWEEASILPYYKKTLYLLSQNESSYAIGTRLTLRVANIKNRFLQIFFRLMIIVFNDFRKRVCNVKN